MSDSSVSPEYERMDRNQITRAARDLLRDSRYDQAERLYVLAIEKFPELDYAHAGLAQVALEHGDLDKAEELYARAREKFPDSSVVLNGYARLLYKQRKFDDSEALFLSNLVRFANKESAVRAAEKGLRKVNTHREDHARFQRAKELFPNESFSEEHREILKRELCKKAHNYLLAEDYDRAENLYRFAITEFPENAVAHAGYAQVALKRDDLKEAEERYTEAVTKFPDHALAHTGRAQVALKRGDLKEAEKHYLTAVIKFPDNAVAHAGHAQVALKHGDLKEAKRRYTEAVTKFPDDAFVNNGLAHVLIRQKEYPQATKILQDLSQKTSDEVSAMLLAVIALRTNDLQLVSQAFDQLVALPPTKNRLDLIRGLGACGVSDQKYNQFLAMAEVSGALSADQLSVLKQEQDVNASLTQEQHREAWITSVLGYAQTRFYDAMQQEHNRPVNRTAYAVLYNEEAPIASTERWTQSVTRPMPSTSCERY